MTVCARDIERGCFRELGRKQGKLHSSSIIKEGVLSFSPAFLPSSSSPSNNFLAIPRKNPFHTHHEVCCSPSRWPLGLCQSSTWSLYVLLTSGARTYLILNTDIFERFTYDGTEYPVYQYSKQYRIPLGANAVRKIMRISARFQLQK